MGSGTACTVEVARENDKPYIVVQLDTSPEPRRVIDWIVRHAIHILNVAGPRENKEAGIHALARDFLVEVLRTNAGHPS